MISTESRRSSVYVGDGSSVAFSFPFKIFNSDEVSVVTSDGILASNLYSVRLNDTAGGVVTLNSPLAHGVKLVIISAIPYTQGLGLTAQGAFNPDDLNKAWDKNCALVQQVKDRVDRAVVSPEFYEGTPSDFAESIFAAQRESAASAASAAQSAQAAAATAARVDAAATEGVNAIRAEGTAQKKAVTTEGNAQVTRIESLYDVAGLSSGMACSRRTIEVSADVPAGTEITLPNSQQYVVGRNHLLLFYNDLYVDEAHFSEVGDADTLSSKIKLTFDMKLNADRPNRLTALVIPLGREEVNELVERVKRVEDALADLSRSVAYVQQTK